MTTTETNATVANLKYAIRGETKASRMYAAFAKKAEEEGYSKIATLFRATSKSEEIHGANHTKVLEGMGEKMEDFTPEFEVKTTKENLEAAIGGETEEFTNMYPGFIDKAKEEGNNAAVRTFNGANETEKRHAVLFDAALKALNEKTEGDLPMSYLVCTICGNTYDATKADDKCAICHAPREKYIEVK